MSGISSDRVFQIDFPTMLYSLDPNVEVRCTSEEEEK
jgi:hypothetical protein